LPFLANVALYRNAGMYGGQFADQVVLLHTWSLAVEEQFYLPSRTGSSALTTTGESALLPCVGAVLIPHAACDRSSAMGALLGHCLLRSIGLWSYSLYLIHWPLLLLAKYYAFDPLAVVTRCALLGATLLLGVLSWRYV
jgi:peptidoglycan/LPS O-acetylase OafA/YrhL